MAHFTTVFLSSTAKDLQPYRDAVAEAIGKLPGFHCVRMEDFGAVDGEPLEVCRERVGESDVFVGLVGHLNGSSPEDGALSYTQIEYEEAKKKGKPRVMFVADDDFPLPARLGRESEEAYQRQLRFREQVKRDLTVEFFHDPQKLATLVVAALPRYKTEASARSAGTGKKPAPRKPAKSGDLTKIESSYLADLVERYRYLDFKGLGISDRVPLRLPLLDMYVPLKARVQTPSGETWARQMRLAGRPVGEQEAEGMGERLSEPQPVRDLLQKNSGLVLLGDPGSGKSTFLKSLALSVASGPSEPLGLPPLLPVLIPLSAYANALARRDIALGKFLPRYFEDRELEPGLASLFERKLAAGEVLLLLDGLDEVREVRRRNLVVQRVEDFYLRHRRAGNKFVLTSRIVGYREVRPSAEGLAEATLVDFDDEEIAEFVGRWTAAIEKAVSGETRQAEREASREQEELLAAMDANAGVRALAANPLLLTILALMKRQGMVLPDRRVELYERCIRTLIKDWNLARGVGRPLKELDLLETLRVLRPLALWMHETSPGVGLVKEAGLQQQLERIFAERKERSPERAALQFLEDVRTHTSLLLDRGGRQYGFIHLTFQEYLAASALGQAHQQEVEPIVSILSAHVGEASWREVSLLTLGYLGLIQERDQAAGAVLDALVSQSSDPAGEASILAGEALLDMGPGAVAEEYRERIVESLLVTLREEGKVTAPRRARAGVVLARIGDPRPEVTTVDGMEFCWVPAGPFLQGSEESDEEAFDDEKPRRERVLSHGLWVGRYPVTVAQYNEYKAETGEHRDSSQGANEPVVGMSWHDAMAFCRWLTSRWRESGRLGWNWEARLPLEEEWEKVARGGLRIPSRPVIQRAGGATPKVREKVNPLPGRRFPWGQEENSDRANYGKILGRSAMGCYLGGASPYGVEELSGNVFEWTQSEYREAPGESQEDQGESAQRPRVLRGGAFYFGSRRVRCACRGWNFPSFRGSYIGFRVVLSPFPL